MEKKVIKLLLAAKKDSIFQAELKAHEPKTYKVGFWWSDLQKVIYASIYMGWLIGKGIYNESDYE